MGIKKLFLSVSGDGTDAVARSRIHERTISLRFLGIMLRVLRLEVNIANQFQPTFALGGQVE